MVAEAGEIRSCPHLESFPRQIARVFLWAKGRMTLHGSAAAIVADLAAGPSPRLGLTIIGSCLAVVDIMPDQVHVILDLPLVLRLLLFRRRPG